jgi:hypothetical protein
MTSTKDYVEQIMKRRGIGTPIDLPWELGYVCPVCLQGDECNLHWSEYNGYLWCAICDIDIPSCMCLLSEDLHIVRRPKQGVKEWLKQIRYF